ncbi:sulfotransferase [Jannaschia sp. Os4]|uniref:sulfotransferase n=1 Tax=Jannaschia sp. Os4 TaxID=2807617 RepID=UPI00193A5E2F|nr:sulfotransferase [Jannaschia sp. Os4]MBM2576188.1 sulfotransferase [Jannaschia sp. Os4]
MNPLLVGFGAPKAGTTWLSRYLVGRDDTFAPPSKEMHFFNRVRPKDRPRLSKRIAEHLSSRSAADARRARLERYKRIVDEGRMTDEAYLSLVCDGAPEGALCYDITPSYGTLGDDEVSRIARLTPDVRAIYIMRDPVDRLWSHARMQARNQSGLDPKAVKAGRTTADQVEAMRARAHAIAEAALSGETKRLVQYSRYSVVAERLLRTFGPERTHLVFFEEMFSEEGVRAICAFLGLPYEPANPSKRFANSFDAKIDPDLGRRLARLFEDEYAAVEGIMGHLPARWSARAGALR